MILTDASRLRAGVDYPSDLAEFDRFYPDEDACILDLERLRWPDGFVCPKYERQATPGAAALQPPVLADVDEGTRWIDARRYDRLASLPIDRPNDTVFEHMLVPANECSARNMDVPCNPLGG